MTPAIRPATARDAAAAAALLGELLAEAVSPAEIAGRLAALAATGSDAVFLAERGGRAVGLAALHWGQQLHRAAPGARLLALVVAAEARRQGIGAALLAHCEAFARARGCGFVEITSRHAHQEAHRFYARQGYDASALRFRKAFG